MKTQRDLLLISVDSPILLGIYEDKRLVKSYARMGKFSDTLPQLFSEILAHDSTKGQPTNSSIVDETQRVASETKQKSGLRSHEREDKTSRLSPKRVARLHDLSPQDEFDIYYANGPGNFSAIKLTHIFLQTLQITLNAIVSPPTKSTHESHSTNHTSAKQPRKIRLFCTDAFHFSNSEFINAYGKIHFYKESAPDSTQGWAIRTISLDSKHPNSFALPQSLDSRIFSEDCTPLYILPAV